MTEAKYIKAQQPAYDYIINYPGTGSGHKFFGSFQNLSGMVFIMLLQITGINGLGKEKAVWYQMRV